MVRDFARGAGTAALLRALPELRGARARPAAGGDRRARAGARRARGARRGRGAHRDRVPAAAAPALLAGWQAERVLRRAAADPDAAAPGGPVVARVGLPGAGSAAVGSLRGGLQGGERGAYRLR